MPRKSRKAYHGFRGPLAIFVIFCGLRAAETQPWMRGRPELLRWSPHIGQLNRHRRNRWQAQSDLADNGLQTALELLPKAAAERGSTAKIEKHLLLLVYQASRAGSVREVLNRLRHSAFVVRDRFTADTWRIFNK